MSTASRWASGILAPLVALFVSAAWYLSRSVTYVHLAEGGMSLEDIASTLRTLGIVGMGGLVAAGAVAIVTGPWIPLVLGAMALCAGLFALGALPAEAAPFALGLAAFGQAM